MIWPLSDKLKHQTSQWRLEEKNLPSRDFPSETLTTPNALSETFMEPESTRLHNKRAAIRQQHLCRLHVNLGGSKANNFRTCEKNTFHLPSRFETCPNSAATTVDSNKLEHGCRIVHTGVPSFFGFGLEDGHVPTFWLLLYCRPLWHVALQSVCLHRSLDIWPPNLLANFALPNSDRSSKVTWLFLEARQKLRFYRYSQQKFEIFSRTLQVTVKRRWRRLLRLLSECGSAATSARDTERPILDEDPKIPAAVYYNIA